MSATGAGRVRMDRRRLVAVGLVALAVVAVVLEASVRRWEAGVTASIARSLFGADALASSNAPVLFTALGAPDGAATGWVGFRVTSQCTVAWLLAPLLFVAGLMSLGRRLTVGAVAVACLTASALLVTANLARLTLILLATRAWGLEVGFRWSHDIYGSLVGVAGVAAAIVVFVLLATRLSSRRGVGTLADAAV